MGLHVSGYEVAGSMGFTRVPATADLPRRRGIWAQGCSPKARLGVEPGEAAENVGVHWTYLGQVERGRRNVTLHNIIKLAQGLGIDPAQLVEGLTITVE